MAARLFTCIATTPLRIRPKNQDNLIFLMANLPLIRNLGAGGDPQRQEGILFRRYGHDECFAGITRCL
jgi:hypothetical protein